MNISRLNVEQDLFIGEKIDEIIVLSFREKPLLHITDLSIKKTLFDYLDLIARCDEIKGILIKESSTKMRRSEYIDFYRSMIRSGFDKITLERMYNAINQFILTLLHLDKMVIHADSGKVILLFMNISLACDYRIVADNTVYQNPNIEIGVVPKGGSVFFLSKKLGAPAASRLLLSGEDINAHQAHQLGIVDKVVPLKNFDEMALKAAKSYARLPTAYSIGIKKLLNFNLRELEQYLEYENELLRRQIQSCRLDNSGKLE